MSSPFLPSVPPASLDGVCFWFGGALAELGGGEPMPFLLHAQCHSRRLCEVAWGDQEGLPGLVLCILRSSVHVPTPLRLGERGCDGNPPPLGDRTRFPQLSILPCPAKPSLHPELAFSPVKERLYSLLPNWVWSWGPGRLGGGVHIWEDLGQGGSGKAGVKGPEACPPFPQLCSWLEGELLRRLPSPWRRDSPDTPLAHC